MTHRFFFFLRSYKERPEKRVAIKSWLSQKLRKAKVYSDKLTNQNVLFFRLHKKQDVTCAPTRVPGAYERRFQK